MLETGEVLIGLARPLIDRLVRRLDQQEPRYFEGVAVRKEPRVEASERVSDQNVRGFGPRRLQAVAQIGHTGGAASARDR